MEGWDSTLGEADRRQTATARQILGKIASSAIGWDVEERLDTADYLPQSQEAMGERHIPLPPGTGEIFLRAPRFLLYEGDRPRHIDD
jgi:hypothetical protein